MKEFMSFLFVLFNIIYVYICVGDSLECEIDSNEYELAIINFGYLRSNNINIKRNEEIKLLNAMENIGFIILTNHGISKYIMDEMWDITKEFFDSSIDNKNSILMSQDYMYGYTATEVLSNSEDNNDITNNIHDQKETLNIYIGAVNKTKYIKWPKEPKNIESVYTNYYRACEGIAAQLLRSFGVVLKLPDNYFDDKIDDHMSVVRALNYPQQTKSPPIGTLRCSPHSGIIIRVLFVCVV